MGLFIGSKVSDQLMVVEEEDKTPLVLTVQDFSFS